MTSYDKKMIHQLKRADGQLQAVLRMMESGQECRDTVTQLSAVRSSLDSLMGKIVAENLKSCLLDTEVTKTELEREEKIEEAIRLIVKK